MRKVNMCKNMPMEEIPINFEILGKLEKAMGDVLNGLPFIEGITALIVLTASLGRCNSTPESFYHYLTSIVYELPMRENNTIILPGSIRFIPLSSIIDEPVQDPLGGN